MLKILSVLFAFCAVVAFASPPPPSSAEPDGMSYTYSPADGYRIIHRATHPGVLAGTQIVLQATATYTNENNTLMGAAQSEQLVITVAPSVWKRNWTMTLPAGTSAAIDSGSGNGGLSINGNQLTVWVNVSNNGQQEQFSWKLLMLPSAGASPIVP